MESKIKLADKGDRIGNFIIDIGIIFITYFIFAFVLIALFPDDAIEYQFMLFVISFLYYVTAETIYGKTVGKLITKTSVVDKYNNKAGFWRIFIRTLIRFFFLDIFTFLFSVSGFHDFFSGTRVVKN
jgi:uncharacterized RDD family membrane protein YckC